MVFKLRFFKHNLMSTTKISLLVSIVFFFPFLVSAQLYTPVDTLLAKSEVQKLTRYFDSKTKMLEEEFKSYPNPNKKMIKEFVRDRKDMIEGLTKNNYLLHDQELEDYINGLLRQITQQNGIAFQELKVFISRDTDPNAYSMGDGNFVFSISLLSSLEREEELLFILGHELAHHQLEHLQKRFRESMEMMDSEEYAKFKKEIKKSKYNKFTKSLERYREYQYGNRSMSRKRELEADSMSMTFLQSLNKHPYFAVTALEKADTLSPPEFSNIDLDLFKKHFSTAEMPFDESWTSGYDFSKYNYQTGKVDIFGTHKDSLRTHPEMEERILHLVKMLPQQMGEEAEDTSEFIRLKEKIQLETVYAHYCLEEYGRGIYLILQLQNKGDLNETERLFYDYMLSLFYGKLAEARKSFTFKKYVDEIDVVNFTETYKLFLTVLDNLRSSELQELSNHYNSN